MDWKEAVGIVKELYEEYKKRAQDAEPLSESEQEVIRDFISFLEGVELKGGDKMIDYQVKVTRDDKDLQAIRLEVFGKAISVVKTPSEVKVVIPDDEDVRIIVQKEEE